MSKKLLALIVITVLSLFAVSFVANATTPTSTKTPTPTKTPTITQMPIGGYIIHTLPAINITSVSADLSAKITASKAQVNLWYEYWEINNTSTIYTTNVKGYYFNGVISTEQVDYTNIAGLKANTTYAFRAVTKESYSEPFCRSKEILSFTTTTGTPNPTVAPPANIDSFFAYSNSTMNITNNSADLGSKVAAKQATVYIWYEYWETANPGVVMTTIKKTYTFSSTLGSWSIDNTTISGLKANTNYSYRVLAQNTLYTLIKKCGSKSFTTLP